MSRSLSSSRRGRCSTYRTCWQMLGRRVLVQEEECLTSSSNSVIRVLPKKSTGRTCRAKGRRSLRHVIIRFFVKSLGEDLYDYRYTSHIAKSQMENHAIDA